MSDRERPRPREVITLGEGRPLVYPFHPDGFLKKLKASGFHPRQETRRYGEQHLTLPIDPGSYRFSFGFPGIDERDTRYFYGNLPVDKQARALQLDTSHPRFQSMLRGFQKRLPRNQSDFEGFCEALYSTVDDQLTQDEEDEDITRMSQILERGRTACAGLVLVAGLLVRLTVPRTWFVQRIDGARHDFHERRPHDIGHNWLRISDGRHVVLYDPFYRNLVTYDLQDLQVMAEDPFLDYPVQALSCANLMNELRPQRVTGIRIVESIQKGKEAWLNQRVAHDGQISGNLAYQLTHVKGGNLDVVNGCLWSSRDKTSQTSGRILFPIHRIERVPS